MIDAWKRNEQRDALEVTKPIASPVTMTGGKSKFDEAKFE
jgi:hypothetical protein